MKDVGTAAFYTATTLSSQTMIMQEFSNPTRPDSTNGDAELATLVATAPHIQ